MATFGEHFKAAVAKEVARTGRTLLILAVLLGVGVYFYQDIKAGVFAAVSYPFSKTAEKAAAAKAAVVEKTGELAAGARQRIEEKREALADKAGDVAAKVREKAPGVVTDAKEKAKEVGGDIKDRFQNWRDRRKTEEQ